MEMPQLHKPIPRRHFEVTPASTDSSHPPSPAPENVNPDFLMERRQDSSISMSPSRTRSILNLTSSTLFGIYSGTGNDGTPQEMTTPWGTGAQTPSQRRSLDEYRSDDPIVTWPRGSSQPQSSRKPRRVGFRGYYLPLALQTTMLFAFGVAYGYLVNQLHEKGTITPVPVHVVDRSSAYYHLAWGIFGVLLGNGLPLLDAFWESDDGPDSEGRQRRQKTRPRTPDGTDLALNPLWYSAVRSVGAFVGIAFAVRRLQWTSTLQVSLTLALANPVLWYLIDRSLPGFAFSSFVGVIGTSTLLLINPNFVPVPAIHHDVTSEKVGVYTWLASILFCTSLCFGAIGRKLQL